jgi:acyl-CoA thioesterase FadM
MEEAEHGFWRSVNLTVYGDEGARIVSWPRVAVACEYFKPAKFEDELDLHLRVVNVGRRSAEFECEFFRGGERIAQGRMTCVCCETSNGKFAPIEIPAAIRAKLTNVGQRTVSEI